MLSAIVGIPLYALFLKHIGDLILAVDRKIIKFIELKILKRQTVEHMNLKVLVAAFSLMVTTILLGALGAYPFNWTYFEGMNIFNPPHSFQYYLHNVFHLHYSITLSNPPSYGKPYPFALKNLTNNPRRSCKRKTLPEPQYHEIQNIID